MPAVYVSRQSAGRWLGRQRHSPTGPELLARYDDLVLRAVEAEAFGITIRAASLADVIESKLALGRDPDLVALPELIELQRRQSTDRPSP
ncbi:MAG: hypothetical protein M3508_09855 [Actinomycetota bacterium]|nr:hypothetical protein [Actinomycetota bacterium]